MQENANIHAFDNFECDDESGQMSMHLPIDSVIYQQYLKTFRPEEYSQQREGSNQIKLPGMKGKLKAPPGWNE